MIASDTDRALGRRLRRMKWVAGGMLVAAVALFVVTSILLDAYPGLGVVRAFAEAALIGGLADWFAVTALFRHPLGLPIPHTAIVPKRKDEIGRALARFVSEHFLVREVVDARLRSIDLAERLGLWLDREANARQLGRDLSVMLDWIMRAVDSEELRESLNRGFEKALARVPVNRTLATLIDVLVAGNHAEALIDQLVQFGREQLEGNRDTIRERIEQRSPWWMPKFVDREIYDQLIGEFERILNEIGEDPAHPARIDFDARLANLARALRSDPALLQRGEALRDEIVHHPAVQEFLNGLWSRARELLGESFDGGFEREVRAVGRTILDDEQVRRRLDGWLRELVIYIVENYREQISEIISLTIAQWDPSATARRIELHIGRDLQFIRINGTLVGGLVGVLLYIGWQAFTM